MSKNIFLHTSTFSPSRGRQNWWKMLTFRFWVSYSDSDVSLASLGWILFTQCAMKFHWFALSPSFQKLWNAACRWSGVNLVWHCSRQEALHPSRTALASIGFPFRPMPSMPRVLAFLAWKSTHVLCCTWRFLVNGFFRMYGLLEDPAEASLLTKRKILDQYQHRYQTS